LRLPQKLLTFFSSFIFHQSHSSHCFLLQGSDNSEAEAVFIPFIMALGGDSAKKKRKY